jgi:pyruvate carboxylase
VFFYGMALDEERTIEIEPGKALVVRLTAVSETDEEGFVRVFFELNGQPRVIKAPNRSAVATRPARRKAEEGNANHVAAPMPGSISSLAVKTGQEVKTGDIILSIEAMKMETTIAAPRDGKVLELLIGPGQPVDAKDLLAVIG